VRVNGYGGARPRDPLLSKCRTDPIERWLFSAWQTGFTARGDPTSPSLVKNKRKTTGYVGQAARPPLSGGVKSVPYIDGLLAVKSLRLESSQ
jgi:hypothetical protein